MQAPCLVLAFLCAPLAGAQETPTAILLQGEPLHGVPGYTTSAVNSIGSSHGGGVVVSVSGLLSGTQRNFLWGSLGDTSLTRLRTDGAAGAVTITDFRSSLGASADAIAYCAGTTSGNALLVDDTLVARVGVLGGPAGSSWFALDDALLDVQGRPWFRGRFTGAVAGRGLFRGLSPTPVFQSGDAIPGMPGFVDPAGAPYVGYDVSGDGNHWLAVLKSTTQRNCVVKDGAQLQAGGAPLITGTTLPPQFQLVPNETYNSFGQAQVASNDRWALMGGTPSGFLLRDGNMYRREGDLVDGRTITGSFLGVALDDLGGIAWSTRIHATGGVLHSAVFREDDLLFEIGDLVDVDGDGVGDAGYVIFDIPGGVGGLARSDDGAVWCLADILVPGGGQRRALLVVRNTLALPYCSSQPNSSQRRARMVTVGSTVLALDDVRLRCADMPAHAFGYFLCSRDAGFVPGAGGSQGDLCLGGAVGRFNGQIQNSGNAGTIEVAIGLHTLPQPTGAVAAAVGETWRFQCWFRDANPTVTSNLSDAVALTLR